MDEKSVCANIQELTRQLNEELKAAHELGLRVFIGTGTVLAGPDIPIQINVQLWREITLLDTKRIL